MELILLALLGAVGIYSLVSIYYIEKVVIATSKEMNFLLENIVYTKKGKLKWK